MDRQRRHRHLRGHRLQHRPRFRRRADADRVAQRDLVAAHRVQLRGDPHHVGERHVALVRTAEHRRDVAAHAHAIGIGAFQDGPEAVQRLRDGGVGVLEVERLGGGCEHRDFGRAGGACTFVALFVRYQHRIGNPRLAGDPVQHRGRVGHLRHPFGADEGGRLDAAQAGPRQPVDQFDLAGRADVDLFVLQAVARADLDDAHVQRKRHLSPPGARAVQARAAWHPRARVAARSAVRR